MPKHSFLLALLISASLTGSAVATDLKDEDTKDGNISLSGKTGSANFDLEEKNRLLREKIAAKKKAKEEKERKRLEEENARLERELAELESSSEDEKDSKDFTSKVNTPTGEKVDLTKKKVKISASTTSKVDEDEEEQPARNTYGLPEELVNFVDGHFGGANNHRGDMLATIDWALRYTKIQASSITMATEFVVDGQTQVLSFPVPVHYNTADFNVVKIYASEVTRPDENGSNLIHVQWKFQYNPIGNGNTLHPTHCYYTPGGKKLQAPNPGSNQQQLKNVFGGFGIKF